MSRPTDTPLLKRSLDRRLWNKNSIPNPNMRKGAIIKSFLNR